jgi:arabinofuranosyltransferase
MNSSSPRQSGPGTRSIPSLHSGQAPSGGRHLFADRSRRLRSDLGLLVLPWLAAGLAVLMYLYYGARATGNFGFPLDDSWIHLQIARNLAAGYGWSFNPGELTGASTAPLWVLLITPLFRLGGDATIWVKAVGCLLYLANVALVADVARRITGDRRIAAVAGLLAAWQPAFVWAALSGMETPLYLFLFLCALRSLLQAEEGHRGAAYAATAWLALAGWARPELWALLPLAWGYLFWRRRELYPGRPWVHVALAAAAIGGFLAFNLALWGRPFPSAFYAKPAHTVGAAELALRPVLTDTLLRFLMNIQETIYAQNPVLIVFLGLGGVVAWHRGGRHARGLIVLLAIVALATIVVTMTHLGQAGFQTYRRFAHALAAMTVLVAVGAVACWDELWGLSRATPGRRARRYGGTLALGIGCLLALAMQLAGLREAARLYANDTASINAGDVAAARWLAANTPTEALVAANDIGAIAYFGGRRILDLIGLATPESIPILAETSPGSAERDGRVADLLRRRAADYVVIFPEWFPHLAEDPGLVEAARLQVPGATALAGEEVVIYQIHPRGAQ